MYIEPPVARWYCRDAYAGALLSPQLRPACPSHTRDCCSSLAAHRQRKLHNSTASRISMHMYLTWLLPRMSLTGCMAVLQVASVRGCDCGCLRRRIRLLFCTGVSVDGNTPVAHCSHLSVPVHSVGCTCTARRSTRQMRCCYAITEFILSDHVHVKRLLLAWFSRT